MSFGGFPSSAIKKGRPFERWPQSCNGFMGFASLRLSWSVMSPKSLAPDWGSAEATGVGIYVLPLWSALTLSCVGTCVGSLIVQLQ